MRCREVALLALLAIGTPASAAVPAATEEQAQAWQAAQAAAEAAAASSSLIPPLDVSEWYTVTIADTTVGYMNTQVSVTETSVKNMELMDVQVSRGTDTSRMAFETVFEEALLTEPAPADVPAGMELSGGVAVMSYDQRFANSEVKMHAKMIEGGITLTSYNGEKEHVTDLELPEEPWRGRMRARLEFTRRCRAGEREIVIQTMRPELGPRIVNLTSTFVGMGQVWDGEEKVESSLWTVQISDVPVNMSEAYPVHGPLRCYRMLQMGLDMPFGHLLAALSSKEDALQAAVDDPTRKLPELVYAMFAPLSRQITDVYDARMVKLRVRIKEDKQAKLELPSAGYQKVVDAGNNQLLVTIDLQAPRRATSAELSNAEFRKPSAMVDSSDEVVVELAHRVDAQLAAQGHKLPSATDAPFKLAPETERELAFALRELVHNHISSKHLSTAYASASETARTGSGDCTEHAVLLAAVLKARHIPARVCHGLVYVEDGGSAISGEATVGADGHVSRGSSDKPGQFGWHMWTQGLVDGRWLDLDATLHVPYSVGHVLVGTSSMSDKEAHNNHMQMAALIGNIEMDLLEVSHKWR